MRKLSIKVSIIFLLILIGGCGKLITAFLPQIITFDITEITSNSAKGGGQVVNEGETAVSERGVCWNTFPNPLITHNKTINGIGSGMFISNLTGLSESTTYYVRAYATNSYGTSYGEEYSFTTGVSNLPVVTTTAASSIGGTVALSGGNVTSIGGSSVTAKGVCWSTSPNPTIANNKTTNGSGAGGFLSTLTPLSPNTTYYARAYATNSFGTGYGNQIVFKTTIQCGASLITDADGNTYNTVLIGSQCWTMSNLKTSKYKDGSSITQITSNSQWQSTTAGAWSYYNNSSSNNSTFGKLYNWYAVNSGKLCPEGWRVPTEAEVMELYTFLGGTSVAGGKMKSTSGWDSPNTGANNSSGFTGLPGGYRMANGTFDKMGNNGFWWTITTYSASNGWYYNLFSGNATGYKDNISKKVGMSCRCVLD